MSSLGPQGLLGLSGQRQRFPGFPAGRGRVAAGARDGEASGGLWGFVPEGALQAAWTRTLAGRQVAESGWCWNNTHVAVAVVRSSDPQLTEVNFTAAATLYTFRQNDTVRNVWSERPSERHGENRGQNFRQKHDQKHSEMPSEALV